MARGPQLAGGRHIATYYTIVNCMTVRRTRLIFSMDGYACVPIISITGKRECKGLIVQIAVHTEE